MLMAREGLSAEGTLEAKTPRHPSVYSRQGSKPQTPGSDPRFSIRPLV